MLKLTRIITAGLLALSMSAANAATFLIGYQFDNSAANTLDPRVLAGFGLSQAQVDLIAALGPAGGYGAFSYDGPAAVGSFALSSLSNLSFFAMFSDGRQFTTSDLLGDPTETGITVFASSFAGYNQLVFTGANPSGGSGGSLDFQTSTDVLSHEPTSGISDPIGCCGGDGDENQFYTGNLGMGLYAAVAPAPVPVPAALWLLSPALGAMGFMRRKSC